MYALGEKIGREIHRPVETGVLELVQYSDWAAPSVPVIKFDKTVRVSGDYKVTMNQVATPDIYSLPKIDDILASLAGGKTFTKLDLAHAYQQIQMDDKIEFDASLISSTLELRPIARFVVKL
jgi:hypothetical protein